MAELKDSSVWLRLGVLLMVLAYGVFVFSLDTPGGSSGAVTTCNSQGKCSRAGWSRAVEAFEVMGYLCGLTALLLVLCLVFMDEVKGNKAAHICFIIFALVAGEWPHSDF